jgi:hypothetical protein
LKLKDIRLKIKPKIMPNYAKGKNTPEALQALALEQVKAGRSLINIAELLAVRQMIFRHMASQF